jgi:hypothetical protein
MEAEDIVVVKSVQVLYFNQFLADIAHARVSSKNVIFEVCKATGG